MARIMRWGWRCLEIIRSDGFTSRCICAGGGKETATQTWMSRSSIYLTRTRTSFERLRSWRGGNGMRSRNKMSSTKLQTPTRLIPVPTPMIDRGALLDFGTRAHQLLVEQREEWPMLRRDYASLPGVQTRALEF